MKTIYQLLFLGLLFTACKEQAPKDTATEEKTTTENTRDAAANKTQQNWADFWKSFNTAVQKDDAKSVIKMTVMPLRGHHHGEMGADHFTSHFNEIFDSHVKETFAKADDRNFNTMVVSDTNQAAMMNVEPGTEVTVINVLYVYDEGTESQTESSLIFNFGKVDGQYKLLSLMRAG